MTMLLYFVQELVYFVVSKKAWQCHCYLPNTVVFHHVSHWYTSKSERSGLKENPELPIHIYYFVVVVMCVQLVNMIFSIWL